MAATNRKSPALALAPWGADAWWITVPSMDAGQDWNGFYAAVTAHLVDLRAAKTVVIDVRGNGGGDGGFGDRLVRLLWGDAMVNAREPVLGPTVYRVTKLNRDWWAAATQRVEKNPEYDADAHSEIEAILARYDKAMAAGQTTFELGDEPQRVRQPPGPDLMRGSGRHPHG
jgi:hypothetical protein